MVVVAINISLIFIVFVAYIVDYLPFNLDHLIWLTDWKTQEMYSSYAAEKMICAVLKTANSQFSSPLDGFIQLRTGTKGWVNEI